MGGEDIKVVVRRFAEECWGHGNFEVADELVAEDVIRNGQPVGRAGLIGVISVIRGALPDFHTDIDDLIAENDKVAWRYSSGGSHTGGPLFGIAAAGKALNWTGTAMLRIEAGKIEEIWDHVDLVAIYTQLGALSPPGAAGPSS